MIDKRKFYFIVNPVSGNGIGKKIIPFIENYFNHHSIIFEIKSTEYAGHAKVLAQSALENNFDVVVAVGGDGTVNEIGALLVNTSASLGIVPIGSGNGLARELQIPLDYKNAVKNLLSGSTIKTDTGMANGHYFGCTAGIGFDAYIAEKFLRLESRGLKGYVQVFLKEYFSYQSAKYEFNIDGESFSENAFFITVANHRQWGNDFFISPLSKFNDGFLDVCILRKLPWYSIPALLIRMKCKTMHKSRYFTTRKASSVKISSSLNQVFHTDGEIISSENSLNIQILPHSLSIISGK